MNKYEMIDMFLIERAIEVLEASDDKINDKEIDKMVSDITDKVDELKKEYRSLSHAIKRKDVAEARGIYKKAEKLIDSIEDKLEDLPDITSDDDKSKAAARKIAKSVLGISTVVSLVAAAVSGLARDDTAVLAASGVTLAGIAGVAGSAYAMELNSTFKHKMVSTLNKYQSRMEDAIDKIIDIENENKEDQIRANTKNININKNSTNTNDTTIRYESSDVIDAKLCIYEAYEAGDITEEDKNELLSMF